MLADGQFLMVRKLQSHFEAKRRILTARRQGNSRGTSGGQRFPDHQR